MTKPERLWWPRYVGPGDRMFIVIPLLILIPGLSAMLIDARQIIPTPVTTTMGVISIVVGIFCFFQLEYRWNPSFYRFTKGSTS